MPSFMSWFGFIFAFGFVSAHLAMMAGLMLEKGRERRALAWLASLEESSAGPASVSSVSSGATICLRVSIVIPAKNEEANLGPLFASLGAQIYRGPLELVLIDDRSTDATLSLFQKFRATASFPVKILHLDDNPGPNFKQKALERGIALATGEYLLFTDADCVMDPDWVASMVALMSDKHTALAIGPVYKRVDGPGFFRLFQAFDHAVRYMYLAAGAGLGVPCGGFGNNLIIRKTALDTIGGYGAVPYSVTEDAALISCVRSLGNQRIRAGMSAACRVQTMAVPSWRELFTQGLRWNNGGLFAPDLETRLVFGALALSITAGILALPLIPFVPGIWMLPTAVLAAMIMNTLATVSMAGSMLSAPWYRLALQLVYMPVHFSLLTLMGLLGIQVRWKGEQLAGSASRG